ncbi:MAG: hypothetical protein SNG38_03925 [Rikenellaceae bacterium]
MTTNRSTSVAIIYQCDSLSEKVIRNRKKLQRRLQQAIKDMVEDGYSNFILPVDTADRHNPFPTTFIDAVVAEKGHNSNVYLTIMLPHEVETEFSKTSAERMQNYTEHADCVIYAQKEHNFETPNSSIEKLHSLSSATIAYFECSCSKLYFVTLHAQYNRQSFVNINL